MHFPPLSFSLHFFLHSMNKYCDCTGNMDTDTARLWCPEFALKVTCRTFSEVHGFLPHSAFQRGLPPALGVSAWLELGEDSAWEQMSLEWCQPLKDKALWDILPLAGPSVEQHPMGAQWFESLLPRRKPTHEHMSTGCASSQPHVPTPSSPWIPILVSGSAFGKIIWTYIHWGDTVQ